VGLLLVISLASLWNYVNEGRFSPLSLHGGINFYIGNNPSSVMSCLKCRKKCGMFSS
jgi:hypothetical protein